MRKDVPAERETEKSLLLLLIQSLNTFSLATIQLILQFYCLHIYDFVLYRYSISLNKLTFSRTYRTYKHTQIEFILIYSLSFVNVLHYSYIFEYIYIYIFFTGHSGDCYYANCS